MKNILKSSLLLFAAMLMLTACSDDNDHNPTLQEPTSFVLNTPALANSVVDLANSKSVQLTCSQPDYGFPALTQYTVLVASDAEMSDAVELQSFTTAKMDIDAAILASTLTTLVVEKDPTLTEENFPLTIPVYFKVIARMITATGSSVPGTEITSNVVALNKVRVEYSLAPVTIPEDIFIVGAFCGWDWNNCVTMVHVNGHQDIYWRMVYIDQSGIKINTTTAWDGNQKGYDDINVGGERAADIKTNSDGNISTDNPGWYLMIVNASVDGRNIIYDVQFNEPTVWLMGTTTPGGAWAELEDGCQFTVPDAFDDYFVSPEFANSSASDSGVRAYIKIPGIDWWRSEFMVFGEKLIYRADGGDQERVMGSKGQKLYINFSNDTGKIE